jgi:hypothetical protein
MFEKEPCVSRYMFVHPRSEVCYLRYLRLAKRGEMGANYNLHLLGSTYAAGCTSKFSKHLKENHRHPFRRNLCTYTILFKI